MTNGDSVEPSITKLELQADEGQARVAFEKNGVNWRRIEEDLDQEGYALGSTTVATVSSLRAEIADFAARYLYVDDAVVEGPAVPDFVEWLRSQLPPDQDSVRVNRARYESTRPEG